MKILINNSKKSIILSALVIIIVSFVIFKITKAPEALTGQIKTIQQSPSNNQGTSNKSTIQPKNVSDKGSQQETNSSSSTSNVDTGIPLVAPYGALVSNHKPGKNGSNTIEESECITTPGATCSMQFTQNGVIKTLDSEKTDSTGTAIWTWDVNKAGLTKGNWQVTAIAKLDSQYKSTTDKLLLEIE